MSAETTTNAPESSRNHAKTLSICNWNRYQHYRTRRPPWVKFYVGFNEDTEHLPACARLLAALLFCVAANKENRIPNDPRWIAAEVSMPLRDVRNGLDALLADEFLRPSTAEDLAARRSRRANDPHASAPDSEPASTDASEPASETAREVTRARAVATETETETERALLDQQPPLDHRERAASKATDNGTPADPIARLIVELRDADKDTPAVIRSFAKRLPPAAFETAREQILEGRATIQSDSAYAVDLLKLYEAEGRYAP